MMKINYINIIKSGIIGLLIGSLNGFIADNNFSAYLARSGIVNSRSDFVIYYSIIGALLGLIVGLFFYKKELSVVFSGIVGAIISFVYTYLQLILMDYTAWNGIDLTRGIHLTCWHFEDVGKCYGISDFFITIIFLLVFSIVGFIIGISIDSINKLFKRYVIKK